MIKYLKENKHWIFSGIGVSGITLIIGMLWYMLPGRGPDTKPPVPGPNPQATASPSIVAKTPSPIRVPSTGPLPTKPTPDSTPTPESTVENNEGKFDEFLIQARKLLELGQYRQACLKYQQAVGIVPDSKRAGVSFRSIGEAKASYDRDDFRTAANKYAEAFQKVSIQ